MYTGVGTKERQTNLPNLASVAGLQLNIFVYLSAHLEHTRHMARAC